MDLEMTGLDPERNVIVEMATLVTDDLLNVVAEGPDLVIGATAAQLELMEEIVLHMHTVSGLLPAIQASTMTVEQAAEETLAFLRIHVPQAGVVPLCGNSIGVDRRFLREHAPELEDFFHYLSIDVSTLKELCKRWRPDIYSGRPHKQTAHRAMDDVRESVAELAYYKRHFLLDAPPPSGTTATGAITDSAATIDPTDPTDAAAGGPNGHPG
jgi:oligoribonuclease